MCRFFEMIITLIIPCTSKCKYMNGISEYDFRQVFGQMFELRMVHINRTEDRISIIEKSLLLQYFGNAHTVGDDHKKMGNAFPSMFLDLCVL